MSESTVDFLIGFISRVMLVLGAIVLTVLGVVTVIVSIVLVLPCWILTGWNLFDASCTMVEGWSEKWIEWFA